MERIKLATVFVVQFLCMFVFSACFGVEVIEQVGAVGLLSEGGNPMYVEELPHIDQDSNKYNKFIVDKEVDLVDEIYRGKTESRFAQSPFGLAIDGKEVASNHVINLERVQDLELLQRGITTRFNSMLKDKVLGIESFRDEAKPNTIAIIPYANYPHFISSAQIRIFDIDEESHFHILEEIPVNYLGEEIYIDESFFDEHETDAFDVVLRVYNSKGHFDETSKVRVSRYTKDTQENVSKNYFSQKPSSHIAISNISLSGGTISVYGKDLDSNAKIKVLKHSIPIDRNGIFLADFVVPNGKNDIDIDYLPYNSNQSINYSREVVIKDYDLFFIGVGDITIGENRISAPIGFDPRIVDDEYGRFDEGRLAFFLRGKIKGEYLLTAKADTGYQELDNLFKGLDDEGDEFYRRIDADKYYPVFSDFSSTEDEYASQGRLYVKLERDQSYIMWGSYRAEIRPTDLNQIRRTLYGGKAKFVSQSKTKYGEPAAELVLFGASPESVAITDEFRGTGGSIYYLTYRNMLHGSEKVRVETRDRHSYLVLNTQYLTYGYDYDIDYYSGRILLNEPLEGAVDDNDVVKSEGDEWGDPAYLVVSYEAETTIGDMMDAKVFGGSGQVWLNDHVKIGATGVHEDIYGSADNKMYGFDGMLRKTQKTYIKGSYSVTQGTNIERNTSLDGGFTTTTNPRFTTTSERHGIDVEAAADFEDLFPSIKGRATGYYRDLESGFTGANNSTATALEQYGASLSIQPNRIFKLKAEYDHKRKNTGDYDRYLGEVTLSPRKFLDITAGVTYQEHFDGDETTDVGGRIKYKFGDNYKNNIYAFGQGVTNKRDGSYRNFGRYGLGTSYGVTDKVSLSAEAAVTDDEDFRGKMRATYERSSNSSYYVGYNIDSDRYFHQKDAPIKRMNSVMVVGGRTKYKDGISMSAEEKYHHGRNNNGHTNSVGLQFAGIQDWKFGTTFEYGDIGPLERLSATGSAKYGDRDRNVRGALEYRREVDTRELSYEDTREVYTLRVSGSENINDTVSVLGKSNLSYSEGSLSRVKRGDFAEASVGLAYRPIQSCDRLSFLSRYQFYYDFPTTVQSTKSAANTRQRTHVFSVDGNYDINEKLTLGFKYGYRHRQEKIVDLSTDWLKSIAHLGILRLDFHVVRNWDIFVEGRDLYNYTADAYQHGALMGIYRHFGNNVKLGAGYSWSEFDEDLTNMNYRNHGWFLNLISKF